MSIIKHGDGQVLSDDDLKKQAAEQLDKEGWTKEDEAQLSEETEQDAPK